MNTHPCDRPTTAAQSLSCSGLLVCGLLLALTPACGDDGDGGGDTAAATTSGGDGADDADPTGADDGVPTTGDPTTGDPDAGSTDDDAGSTDGDSTGSTSGIAIEGVWIETYPETGVITHTIDDLMWIQDDADFGPFDLTIVSYDNDAQVVIADDGFGTFSKLNWAWTDDDSQLWYCTAVFGAETAEAAEAGPDGDPTDPGNGGCGGFAWSALNPE